MRLNWNRERWRTRDRLLDYLSAIKPPYPQVVKKNKDKKQQQQQTNKEA